MIDRFPPDWQIGLQETLTQWLASAPDAHIHLLLDAAHLPGVLNKPEIKQFDHINLFQHKGISRDAAGHALSPVLLTYSSQNQAGFLQLLNHADGLPMLSLWHTPETLEQLAERLAAWCIVKTPDQPLMLHFADTRILPVLVEQLDDEQSGHFLGPAITVLYQQRDGALQAITPKQPAQAAVQQVSLSDQQVQNLLAASEADGMLSALRTTRTLPQLDTSHEQLHNIVTRALQIAHQIGLSTFNDRMALVRHILDKPSRLDTLLSIGPNLLNQPVQAVMEQLA